MALTERYVNSAGSGDGSGSSEANAMSFANFTDYMVTGGSFTAAAGDRFNLKLDGTYARTTTADTWVNGGTSTSPVIVRGYGTVPGDGYLGRTNGNGALITTNMPVITYTTGSVTITGSFIVLESVLFSGARNGYTVAFGTGTDGVITRCKISNATTGSGGAALTLSSRATASDNDFTLTNGGSAGLAALSVTATGCRVLNNRITSTAIGISDGAVGAFILRNTVFGCGTSGIALTSTSGYALVDGNTVAGCTGDGIDVVTGTTVRHDIINNMLTDNGGYGIDLNNAAVAAFLSNNRYRDNTSGAVNLGTDWVSATDFLKVTTDTGGEETDYQDAGSDDYRLILASPAKAAGIPKYASIGALQREEPSGGGGGPVISGPPLIL